MAEGGTARAEALFAEAYPRAIRRARKVSIVLGGQWAEDLQSAATERLWLCATRFDQGRGVSFVTYWWPQVREAMVDELRRLYPGSRQGQALVMVAGRRAMMGRPDDEVGPEDVAMANAGLEELAAVVVGLPLASREIIEASQDGELQRVLADRDGVTQSAITYRKRAVRRAVSDRLRPRGPASARR